MLATSGSRWYPTMANPEASQKVRPAALIDSGYGVAIARRWTPSWRRPAVTAPAGVGAGAAAGGGRRGAGGGAAAAPLREPTAVGASTITAGLSALGERMPPGTASR